MKHFTNNPRSISKKRFEQLKESMIKLGDLSGVTHDLDTDELITGNQRSEAGDFINKTPVIIQEFDPPLIDGTVKTGYFEIDGRRFNYRAVKGWTEEERMFANLVANSAGGDWNWDILANIDAEVLSGAGFDKEMLKGLKVNAGSLNEFIVSQDASDSMDAEPQIERADELLAKWGVEYGQLWQVGEHRLLCGDSTKREDVARVMGGEKAELAPVDPPYNVGFDYDGSTVDDNKQDEIYEKFSKDWFNLCQSVSDRQIVTPGCNNLALWLRWFDAYHWTPWTKSNAMTNGKVSRFWCWEPMLFFGDGWKRKRGNDLFDFPIGKQVGVANHPCPKPLKMWEDLIHNYSEDGAIIFESFCGSGTTLVACQNLGRKGRGIEISPAYVAVTLERMADAFPELEIKLINGDN